MSVRLEHANLCVRDIEEMIRFLQAAFPEFQVRGDVSTTLCASSTRQRCSMRWSLPTTSSGARIPPGLALIL